MESGERKREEEGSSERARARAKRPEARDGRDDTRSPGDTAVYTWPGNQQNGNGTEACRTKEDGDQCHGVLGSDNTIISITVDRISVQMRPG